MSEITIELWLAIIFALSLFMLAIAAFCFIRISGKHIEREMKNEGKLPPAWDSTMGLRYHFYAIVIVRNSIEPMSFVDDEAVLRFARKKDRYLAYFFVITSAIFLLVIFIAYFFFDLE
ncbi:hypothetical protein SG34_000385 [Thalassomonas viridans]|uniref:Uncharacterized protein n=1 Tax=Thalassomonas viridans TaxID=137584 RepID=A0AAF0C956_9GAMM|nr:hypothetical protein [Thalassomonas viridans]WDE05443.1 hypothetical protein SG34_000385 [Thalassomonas viridans]